MLTQLKKWFELRRAKAAAIQRAIAKFQPPAGLHLMEGFVLHIGSDETIVRIMYHQNVRPPHRAWFAVSNNSDKVRELSFDDVCMFEAPWR